MSDSRPVMTSARSRMGTSNLGGVPTALPDLEPSAASTLALDFGTRPTERHDVMPGVVLITGWLDTDQQRALVDDFRSWSIPPAGLRHPRVPSGHLMTVQSVCLGWHWQPYAYTRTADDTDGAPVKPIPRDLARLSRRAVAETFGDETGATYAPDAVIANLYTDDAKLGLHQDGEEPSEAPVVTISIGDACLFRMKNRLGVIGVGLILAGGAFAVAGGVAYAKVQDGYDSLQAFSEKENVQLTYNDQGQLVDRGSTEEAQAIMQWHVEHIEVSIKPASGREFAQ